MKTCQARYSNLPFGRWGETFSDDVVVAMIDRLVHHAEVLTLTCDSYRTRQRRELLTKKTAPPTTDRPQGDLSGTQDCSTFTEC